MGMEQQITERIKELAAATEETIIADRRYFHAHPELSSKEVSTAGTICARLARMGIPYERVAKTGIIATIAGTADDAYDAQGNPKKRVALRADIDALPVLERTGLPYESKNTGVMHACGHDCHIAMLRCRAHPHADARSDSWRSALIFQPAEEISIGSRMMIKAGALDGVDGVFGMHIWSEIEAGLISADPGQRMANTDWFRVDIEGVSAHGSMPHKGVDAVVVAAELVVALQVLVSRDISPFEPLVVTVGEVHGGEARNIMAGSAYLTGTVRTWSKKTREAMPDRLRHLMTVGQGFGATAKLTYEAGNAGLSNDKESAERAQESVKKLFEEALADYQGTLAGEDLRIPRAVQNIRLCCHPKMDAMRSTVAITALTKASLRKGLCSQHNTRSIFWLNSAANGALSAGNDA
ncbi:MAG: amidohydrolase [Slackia sp.]